MKKLIPMVMATIMSLAVVGCTSPNTTKTQQGADITISTTTTDGEITQEITTDDNTVDVTENSTTTQYTKETLAQYDGKNGNKAYVAINGVVYDVTNNKDWKEGSHNGQMAGQDLTEVLGSSPHGESVLGDLPVIGTYVN